MRGDPQAVQRKAASASLMQSRQKPGVFVIPRTSSLDGPDEKKAGARHVLRPDAVLFGEGQKELFVPSYVVEHPGQKARFPGRQANRLRLYAGKRQKAAHAVLIGRQEDQSADS
jgi:hypothetical protein